MRNETEDGMGFSGLVATNPECSAEDAFQRERAAYERLERAMSQNREALYRIRTALEIACGAEVTRQHVELFNIEFRTHECGCDVCARSTKLCPATQSSLAQEIFGEALKLTKPA